MKDLCARHARVVLCLAFAVSLVASLAVSPALADEGSGGRDTRRDTVIGATVPNAHCEAAGLRGLETGACTHGADDLAAATGEATPVTAQAVQCDGDGVSGRRVQLVYARASDRPDTFATSAGTIRQIASSMDSVVNSSAAETGGTRRVRFVHDSSCNPTVLNLTLPTNADDNFSATISAVKSQGLTLANRRYLIFMDTSGVLCGIGEMYNDDSASLSNWNNNNTLYARVDKTSPNGASCWTTQVATHELMHNLGAVQNSAPHTTYNKPFGNPGGHCVDEYDIMCYPDYNGISPSMQILCADAARDASRLDCNNDDYFHTNPPTGSYLATHWNVANNQYLFGTSSTPPPSGTCTDSATEPDNTTTQARALSLPASVKRAFCAASDQDWATFSAVSGTVYTVETTTLSSGTNTQLHLYASNGTTQLAFNNDRSSTDKSSSIRYTATTTGKLYVRATQVGGAGSTSYTYTLKITGSSSSSSTCPDVAVEPDNSRSAARLVTRPVTQLRAFCGTGDYDWVKFTVTAGTTIRAETLNLAPGVNTVLDLYSSSGTLLASNNNRTSTDLSSLVRYTAKSNTTLYVRVRQYGSGSGITYTYTLKIS